MTAEIVDLPALRAYLVAHAVPGLDEVEVGADGSSVHRRLVAVRSGSAATLTVTLPAGPVGSPATEVHGGPDAVAIGTAAARRWLGLDLDPAPGVAALGDDRVIGPLVGTRPHLRVPGSADPFETAVLVVLGQHVSLAAGRRFAARLVDSVGCSGGGHDSHLSTRLGELRAFPEPEALAALDAVELQRAVGVTGARARTVVALARAVADGRLTLSATTEPAPTRATLLDLPGVGPWTADLIALRCLRDPDVFLPGDLVLRKALGGVPTAEAAQLARGWAPHRSLAVIHLWTHHALDPRR